MVAKRQCAFCAGEIEPGRGVMFVKRDGTVFYFCSGTCRKHQLTYHRVGHQWKWTRAHALKVEQAKGSHLAGAKTGTKPAVAGIKPKVVAPAKPAASKPAPPAVKPPAAKPAAAAPTAIPRPAPATASAAAKPPAPKPASPTAAAKPAPARKPTPPASPSTEPKKEEKPAG